MTLTDLLAEIESRFACRSGIFSSRCNTGEPYVMIGEEIDPTPSGFVPGVVREKAPRATYENEAAACQGFLVSLRAYGAWTAKRHLISEPVTLWWRYAWPRLFLDTSYVKALPDGTKKWKDKPARGYEYRCFVRGRVCLTSEPVVWSDQAAYIAAHATEARATPP